MCGIAGFITATLPNEAPRILGRMAAQLTHRGPDGSGAHVETLSDGRSLGLTQTLLSIIGRPGEGKQPFHVPGGVLVFNGAIYNFRELREELRQNGVCFRTETDTEVLAQGLSVEGLSFLPKIRGMFAFAFWHSRDQVLWLGRDPFGVKPLYFTETESELLFASEYKAILPFTEDRTLNEQAVYDYLRLRYVPGESTLIKAVEKVGPGTVRQWKPGQRRSTVHRYFFLEPRSDVPSEEELFHLLSQAVSRRAVASVEVAGLLSGGVDSSFVCERLSSQVPGLKTYTLSFPGESIDESRQAKLTSQRIGVENITIPNRQATGSDLARLAYHLDDPYGDPIILALDRIFAFIGGRQRLVVTGEGADEIFSGYVHHRVMALWDKTPQSLLGKSSALIAQVPHTWLARLFPYAGKMSAADFTSAMNRFRRFCAENSLGSFQAIFSLFDETDFNETGKTNLTTANTKPSLKALRDWDLRNWLPDSQLFKLDKISMAHSIEAREPFVDQDLIAAVGAVALRKHFAWKQDKPLFRRTLGQRTKLNPEIVRGKKSSFFHPLTDRTAGALREEIRAIVGQHHSFLSDYVQPTVLRQLVESRDGGLLNQKRLFALGMLALWRERLSVLPEKSSPVSETRQTLAA